MKRGTTISGNNNDKYNLQLISPAFGSGIDIHIPAQYTCKGQNINPPLNISGIPKGAKSLALIMHDPDAVGSDFTHWLLWNIPLSTQTIAANSVPAGAIQGLNSAGKNRYMGPCPPAGTGVHRYMFELYALNLPINIGQNSGRGDLEKVMGPNVIDKYTLTGLFGA